MAEKIKQFPVLLSEKEMKDLAIQAGKEDISKGAVLREALKQYLESKEGK